MQPPPEPEFRGLKSARKWAKQLRDFCISQSVTSINSTLPTAAGPTGKIFNIPVGKTELPTMPTTNGVYLLQLTVSAGVPTLSWFTVPTSGDYVLTSQGGPLVFETIANC